MVLRCGALSHVDVDENDVIWQLPRKTSAVRWPTSSSIATTIPENKRRPRGILKSSNNKIRFQNGNNDDDDDDDRDCSSAPRTSDENYYPLARLENAGNTPRGRHRPKLSLSFTSPSPHRRGRIQSHTTKSNATHNPNNKTSDSNNSRNDHQQQHQQKQESVQPQTKYYKKNNDEEQPERQRRSYHCHPTACPVCSGTLTYLHISSATTTTTNNNNNINNINNAKEKRTHKDIDKQLFSSIACTTTSAILAPVAALREMKQRDNNDNNNINDDDNEEEEEYDKEGEYHNLLQRMCNLQSLLPPLCKTCKTYILFDDDTECKYDMMENFERWYLDMVDHVAVDDNDNDGYDERDERNNARNHGRAKVDNDSRARAKIIVVGGDTTTSPHPPSLRAAVAPVADLSVTEEITKSTVVADSASLNAKPATKTVLHVSEEEREIGKMHDMTDSQHWEDNITPRLSNRVSCSTLQIDNVDGSVEWRQTVSQSEQSLLANSSISESIQLIHTESEERKILETYSIT